MAVDKQDPFKIQGDGGGTYAHGKLVGGYVPKSQAAYLRLLALYKHGSVQSVLQEMIKEWIHLQEPRPSIVETLADRVHMEWIRRDADPKFWHGYENEIIARLTRRKISPDDIDSILNEMRSRIGKNK